MNPEPNPNERRNALLILCIMPLFFSTNIVFGSAAVAEVEPFTLAFLRWTLTALILLPFAWSALNQRWSEIRSMAPSLMVMGFLGMWICGALVYLALKYTSATNGTLIYTSSPVMIIVIEWLFRGRKIGWRDVFGIILATLGVLIIVAKGEISNLINLQFNAGDLIFVFTAFSWAIYSVWLKSQKFQALPTLPLFMLIAACGALLLAPFAVTEIVILKQFPTTFTAWRSIAGIVIFASVLAFGMYQYGVKILGASLTGISLYLLPVYGVTLAIIFLGESFREFHLWGILLVLGGVVLATLPSGFFKRG